MESSAHTAPEPADTTDAGDLPFTLPLELTVQDAEVIAELCRFAEGEPRDQFALKALKIGVLALKQARGQIDGDLVRREGERLMADLKSRLDHHEQLLNERLGSVLKEYFDPQNGRFQERIERLVRQDGELEQTLKKQIAGDDSALSRTLLAHFGEESRLMKMLSPEQSRGILGLMKETLDEQLRLQRDHVLGQFSLDRDDSALSRLVRELQEHHGKLSEGLAGKIDDVVKEFSLDEENSALSRLVRNVDTAQRTITREFSLDEEQSSLARLQRTLTEILKSQQDANQKFQEEVKLALEEMKARKDEAQRSTRHGVEFETLLFEQLQKEAQKIGDIATHTGNTTGNIRNSKVGDAVVELGPDAAAAGQRIVVEAKEVASYSLQDARAEIAVGRDNRAAQIGLFIFSKRTAPAGLDAVTRYGDDVFIVWDAEDERSDLYLRVGYTLARALCTKRHALAEDLQADFTEIDKAILEITKQTDGLDDIDTWAKTSVKACEKILNKVATARKKLQNQIDVLRDNVDALRQGFGGDQ